MHSKVKIWYAACLLFSIYNLKLLVDDSNEVNYIMVDLDDELYSNQTVHTICISFDEVKSKSRLPIEAAGNVSIAEFLRHSMASMADAIRMGFPDPSLFDLTRSHVNNQQVCFPFARDAVNSNFFKRLIKTYSTFFYTHSPAKQTLSSEYYYLKYDQLEYFSANLVTRVVYGEKSLNSECSDPSEQLAKNRFFCLNSCYKQNELSEFIFYRFDEDVTLNLNLIQPGGKLTEYQNVQSRKKMNEACFSRCPYSDCFLEIYFSANKDSHPDLMGDPPKNELLENKIVYQAFYSLSYFWLQLIGLATLLTGTSLTVTLPVMLARLYDRFKFRFGTFEHFRYYQRYYPKFRFALLVFSFLFFLVQSTCMYEDYRHKSLYPNRTRIGNYTSEIEPFTMIICLGLSDELQLALARNSVAEIGNLTEQLRNAVEVNLLYGNKNEKFNYSVSRRLLFKTETFGSEQLTFRCFSLDFIKFYLLKYRRAIPFTIIETKFSTTRWRVYLTEREQPLTSGLLPFNGENYFEKDIYRYAEVSVKASCKDYARDVELNCDTRQHCADRCYNRQESI